MGMCLPSCLQDISEYDDGQDIVSRRTQQAAAAERRLKETESRGLKDPEGVKRKLQKKEEMERKEREAEAADGGGGTNLRWTVD